MPDWEKIEFTRKSLKRKEVYNEFGKKVRFEPLQSIPKLKRNRTPPDQYGPCCETLLWKENESLSENTDDFVKLALSEGFSEEQALHILHYNHFDLKLARCDLHVYQPRKGLHCRPSGETICTIADSIKITAANRQNRDLNMILMEFPANTMGELLDFYANNRMSIKKKTAKFKPKKKRIGPTKLEQYLTQMNPLLCGEHLHDHLINQSNDIADSLGEICDLIPDRLDKYLIRYSKKIGHNVEMDNVDDIDRVLENNIGDIYQSADDECEGLQNQLDSLFLRLDDMEQWMVTGHQQKTKIQHKWNNVDLSLFLLGLSQFGTDFSLLSDAVATKTPAMVESFYRMFRDRYQFDKIIPRDKFDETI